MKRKLFSSPSSSPSKRKRTAKQRAASSRARVTTVVRAPGPVPPRSIVKMRYVDLVASNGTTMDHLWNLNSTFDPNLTGTGHQPYGRDTLTTLYNRYRVFAVKYKVTYTTAATQGCYGIISWDNEATTYTNSTLMQENPKSRMMVVTPDKPAVFRGHLSLARIVGQTPAQYKADDRFQALSTTDPAENIIFHTGHIGLDGTILSSSALFIRVQFTYYVEWFDQNKLGQS